MIRRIVFTREHALADDDRQLLEAEGFKVNHVPLITCQPNPLPLEVKDKIKEADWVFFTSAVALDCFRNYFPEKVLKIASIGAQTTLAVKKSGHAVDFEAQSPYAVDFVRDWLKTNADRQEILLPQSRLSSSIIADSLIESGQGVTAWAMYDTKVNLSGQSQLVSYLNQEGVLWVFASPSAFQSFQATIQELPANHRIAVIGTTTAKAVTKAGYTIFLMPEEPSIKKMVEMIIETGGDRL